MFSSSERMYPQKPHNARDASSLARTKGPYLHELHNAGEDTCKLPLKDSWSQPRMTTRKPTTKYYTFVLFIKRRAVLYASVDAKHRKDKRMSNLLEHAFVFSMYSFVLMFFCLNKVYPRETALCPRHVIPGQDQGPYLHEMYNAG